MIIIAHKGLHSEYTENSLEAILEGALRCDGVEFDVQLTKCGTAVVFHDETLKHAFGVDVPISELTLEDLARLTEEKEEVDLKIPTLEEVLTGINVNAVVNIELKSHHVMCHSSAKEVARLLRRHPLKNLIVSSFNPLELLRFRRHYSGSGLGLLTEQGMHPFLADAKLLPLLKQIGLTSIHPHYLQVNEELLQRAEKFGVKVFAWTVNAPNIALNMVEYGVDGIISDKPFKCDLL